MRYNDDDRTDWVNNYEPLYLDWQATRPRQGIRVWVRAHRDEIDAVIDAQLNRSPS